VSVLSNCSLPIIQPDINANRLRSLANFLLDFLERKTKYFVRKRRFHK
jgi:hypothetical protein